MEINKELRFLVVDDFESMRKVTVNQLRLLGASHIVTAVNGAEAEQILKTQPIDIVLSDWNMPIMNGLDLLKAVRNDKKLSHLPFVMITAEAAREQVLDAIAYEVSELIIKPYTAARLAERITRALSWKPRNLIRKEIDLDFYVKALDMESPDVPQGQEKKPSILVVDDTPDNLQLLSKLFQDEYQVRVAHNGERALAICESDTPPDLVLLDIMMPGMDGFEVAKRMREHPVSENIPIIFVTSITGNDVRMKGMELGAVDFVTKPVNPDELKPRIRNFLRYVELHKQLQADYDMMQEVARLREDVEHITRHDIKGPLAGIIGMVQMLSQELAGNPSQAEQLRLVEQTALQAMEIINLSSELYKVETGRYQLDPQPVQIGDILWRIVENLRAAFAGKQLTLVLSTESMIADKVPKASGDAMFCYSIFQNLIKNACEATPPKSRVFINVLDKSPLQIVISNTGTVPAEIRERFFDKFVTHGKSGGTGLGTYSARQLTEAQKGAIALEVSDTDNTSTITVTLPRL